MYVNIATGLINLERNIDYKPVWVNTSTLLKDPSGLNPINNAATSQCGNGYYDKYPIFRIQVSRNNVAIPIYVRLWLWLTPDAVPVDVPIDGFLEGHTYDMFFKKYTLVDGASPAQEVTNQDANFILTGHYGAVVPLDMAI